MSVPFGCINGYTLVDRLGGPGAFGAAFEARKNGKRFVVKVFHAELLEDIQRERFAREVKAMERLETHPNVVSYLESGEHEDGGRSYPFIVMPYLPGRTLRQLLEEARGPLPPGQVRNLARQICAGLAAMHENEIVHRDLKPSNIFVCDDGTVVLLDFGVARFLDYTSLTEHGQLVGTLQYAAPEQIRNEAEPASDLWALGVVTYEMLAGKRPFRGQLLDLMHAVLNDDPEPVSSFAADVSPDLEGLVMRLLEKEPFDRPRSANEVIASLQSHASEPVGVGVGVVPYPGGQPPMLFLRGNDRPAPVVDAILCGLNPSAVVMPITDRHAVGVVRRTAKEYNVPYGVDPFGFRLAYANFTGIRGLRERRYAPPDRLTPYRPDDLRTLESARRVAVGALDEQDECGADVLFAPSFAIRDLDDRWLARNAKLLQLSLAHAEALGKPLFATLALPVDPLASPDAQTRLVNRMARGRPAGFIVNFDQLDGDSSAARLFWALRLMLLIQESGSPAILGRAGILRHLFLAFGVSGVEYGLGRLAGFRLADFSGDRKPFGNHQPRFEFPSLLDALPTDAARLALESGVVPEADCDCRACSTAETVGEQLARTPLHNAEMLKREAHALAWLKPQARIDLLRAQIARAQNLQRELKRKGEWKRRLPQLTEFAAAIELAAPLLEERIQRRAA